MTLRSRLAAAWPVWAFAVSRSREATRLAAKVRQLTHDLAALRATVAERNATIAALDLELAITKAREKVAIEARDRARDLAGALMGEERAFSAGDLAWMDDHEIGAE